MTIKFPKIFQQAAHSIQQEFHDFFIGNFVPTPWMHGKLAERKNNRIEFIDLAKGICIILVVVLHCPRVNIDLPGLSALRMPLYFILSGLFFKTYGSFANLAEKKINKIFIPFIFFFVVDWAVLSIYKHKIFTLDYFTWPWDNFRAMKNVPIWFLCALFYDNLIFCAIKVYLRKPWAVAASILTLGATGHLLTHHGVYLPFYFTQALNGLPFFYLGSLIKNAKILYPGHADRWSLPLGVVLLGLGIGVCYLIGDTPKIDFYENRIHAPIWGIYPVALLMVFGCLMLCKAIRWLPIVSYIGRYSIITLGLHKLFILRLRWFKVDALGIKLDGMYLLLTVLVACWLLIPILRLSIPWFVAQKDVFRLPALSFPRRLLQRVIR